MPIYEYECQACGQQSESLQRISDPPLTDCTACGQPALKKLVSRAGFQLKGTGWYVTDFRDKGSPAKESKKSGSPGGDAAAGDKAAGSSSAGSAAASEKGGGSAGGDAGKAATGGDKPSSD